MLESVPLLSLMVWTPAVAAVVVALLPERLKAGRAAVGWAGMVVSLAIFGVVAWRFEPGVADFQFVEDFAWAPAIGSRYVLGIDGISLWMAGLTVLLFPLSVLATLHTLKEGERAYLALLLVLETAILGAFLALDLLVFFVFWEAVLVPMYFLIAGWGSERRTYAAIKFFLYTMAGSAFLLVGIVYLAVAHSTATGVSTFDLRLLESTPLDRTTQVALFGAFALGFAVKVPVFPLHTWLPDAHTEAPTAGSVILAGVLLKLGVYGFLRFSMPLFPEGARAFLPLLVALGLVGIVYGAVVAAVQKDLKRLVAYSSVSHLGFSVVGIFVLTLQGSQGGLLQMFNHGVSTGALFLLVGMIYERLHTRRIEEMGGIWSVMPVYGGLFLFTALASIGLPGLGGFVGEFLVLAGSFLRSPWVAATAGLGVVLSAVYLLWAYQRAFTGEVSAKVRSHAGDLSWREVAAVLPLAALMLGVGLFPGPFVDRSEASLRKVVDVVAARTDLERPDLSHFSGTSRGSAAELGEPVGTSSLPDEHEKADLQGRGSAAQSLSGSENGGQAPSGSGAGEAEGEDRS